MVRRPVFAGAVTVCFAYGTAAAETPFAALSPADIRKRGRVLIEVGTDTIPD